VTEPTFALTRHFYESYRDFYRLIELSGYPTCYVDEIQADDPTRCYIFMMQCGETEQGWPGAKARIIQWMLEWFDYSTIPGVAERWSGDQWHADRVGARYVPVGSDVRLADGPDAKFAHEYDVALLAYMIPRRTDILSGLAQRGVKVSPTSAWGNDRHLILKRSTTYLHVHQWDDKPAIPALRMVVAAAYSLPVICETPAQRGIFDFGHMLTSDHAHIAEFVYMWSVKERGAFLQSFGDGLHRLLCHDLTFRRSVEVAL
jgi:hypothetical protein